MKRDNDALDAAQKVANRQRLGASERIVRKGRFVEFTLENGIVLECRPIAPLLLTAVQEEFPFPDPPRVWLEDKGREEENPNDPNYIRECEAILKARDTATTDFVLGSGTSVKTIPEGYYGPDEDGWLRSIEMANRVTGKHIEIEKADELKRYVAWLTLYGFESYTDITLAAQLCLELSGLRESEVVDAMRSFRGDEERGSDPGGSPGDAGADGDRDGVGDARTGASA